MVRKDEELSTEDREKIRKAIKKAGRPSKEYQEISELLSTYYSVLNGTAFISVEKVIKNGNELICTLENYGQVFEENAVYPLSELLDEIDRVFSRKFIAFLEWHVLKNADITLL